MIKGLKILLFFIIIIFVGLWGYVRYLEKVSVFHPSRSLLATPQDVGLEFEDIYLKTKDGLSLNGWLVKHPQARSTVIYFHGNAGNIGDRVEKLNLIHSLGVNVFIIDYRGYGKSTGIPTEAGLYEDARAAYQYITERQDIANDRLILYGGSLGAVASLDLASRYPVTGIIIDSSFTSAADMGRTMYPFIPSFFLQIKMDSLSKIKNLSVPKLIIHSPEDDLVPFWMGQKLFETAAVPKEFLEIKGGHNDGHIVSKEIWLKGLQNFFIQYQLN